MIKKPQSPPPVIDAKVSRAFELYTAELEEQDQEDIQSFLAPYAEHFIINWERENTLQITTKYKKGKMILDFKFKSKSLEKVKADQTNQPGLFDSVSKVTSVNVHNMLEHVDSLPAAK